MPYIGIPYSKNPEEQYANVYGHGRRGRPMLFQITDPVDRPIWPFLLALHTNPDSFDEKFTKSKNVVMTYGGFVEFVWPDELDSISASHSTGAFLGPFTGLTSGSEGISMGQDKTGIATRASEHGRHGTMAWERQEDLLELFRSNGNIFNGQGIPAVRGRVMCIYDRGVYVGHFTTFSVRETDEKAFSFELSWEFKVEDTRYHLPVIRDNQVSQSTFAASVLETVPPIETIDPTATQGNGPEVPPSPLSKEEAVKQGAATPASKKKTGDVSESQLWGDWIKASQEGRVEDAERIQKQLEAFRGETVGAEETEPEDNFAPPSPEDLLPTI